MLKKNEQLQVHDMLATGMSVAEVAQRTGRSLGTIYKYKRVGRHVQSWGSLDGESLMPTELQPYQAELDTHLARRKVNLVELYFLIQKNGYHGSQHLFNRYARRRRQELQPVKHLQHVETSPGEQAQVDWGHFGEITINGKREKVYLFAYILSWSRALYMEFVVRQNQRTLQACHIHAFEKLGIPQTILYDNMKTVVIRREKLADGSKEVHYNLNFLDFARYYQFEPIACPPYWPRAKGKVEASIKFARNYFARCTPNAALSLAQLNDGLQEWLETQAQQRVHASTGEKPYDRWLQEKQSLSFPDKLPPYQAAPLKTYRTTQYGLLTHNGTTYHLGQAYALLKLEVREIDDHGLPLLEIYRRDKLLATVPVPTKKHSWITVFEDQPAIAPSGSSPNHRAKTKKPKLYDITVATRDLSYYSLPVSAVQGGQ